MTWKNGSTYNTRQSKVSLEGVATGSVVGKTKSRTLKAARLSRFKKKKESSSRAVDELPQRRERVVQFEFPVKEDDKQAAEFARTDPFRRSSKFRQPVRRISRPKGSPPPSQLARIYRGDDRFAKIGQPNFDQTSDGESADEEEPLPPILLENVRNETEDESSESTSDDEEETYTVLPAVTVATSTVPTEHEELERHSVADNPLESQWQGAPRRVSVQKHLIRRRSSYRASVRRASMRRVSIRRESVRATVRRQSNVSRRQSIVVGTVRRRSSAVPGYVYRRRSVAARSPCGSKPLQYRKRRKRVPRQCRRPRKIVVIGDMCSGKSSLISAYCRDKFSELYVPTILTSCMTDADVLGEKIELVVVEVAGRIDYAKIRRCAYHKMDLVILCYSADRPSSLAAIKTNWLPELKKVAPEVPYILVGTKTDIREEKMSAVEHMKHSTKGKLEDVDTDSLRPEDVLKDNIVTTRQGVEAAESIGAKDFLECSAMYRDGTRDVFEMAAKIALRRSPRRKKKHPHGAGTCTIL